MSVNMVVNYDMPWDPTEKKPDVETYLHRSGFLLTHIACGKNELARLTLPFPLVVVGRTGRFGRQGICEPT